jgi:DNA-binding transcriptional MocR family regulator
MLERSSWHPRLAEGPGLLHERLAGAFADDIIEQIICAGARLPAHRDLAYRLGISVGTVTKAYALLERQGLVRSDRGRAMFAVGVAQGSSEFINLSVNVPPKIMSDRLLSATMREVARQIDVDTFSAYPPPEGQYAHRATIAAWMSEARLKVNPDELILCNGARHALAVAFSTAGKQDDVILTEDLPYTGAAQICEAAGLQLEGISMDAEGLNPDSFEARLKVRKSGRKPCAVYITPTAQNPTGCSMSLPRRRAIVELCRASDLLIIEDDVYAVLGDEAVPTIRELAPERTIYVGGVSKTFTPGLRIGFLVCPERLRSTALRIIASIGSPVSALSCLIMDQWIVNGTAAHLSLRIRTEAGWRMEIASNILGIKPSGNALHVFLSLPSEAAADVARRMAELGVRVTPPSLALQSGLPSGIRLCLGAPPIDELERALRLVRTLL